MCVFLYIYLYFLNIIYVIFLKNVIHYKNIIYTRIRKYILLIILLGSSTKFARLVNTKMRIRGFVIVLINQDRISRFSGFEKLDICED